MYFWLGKIKRMNASKAPVKNQTSVCFAFGGIVSLRQVLAQRTSRPQEATLSDSENPY
jgi:hypothetical protein